MEKNLVVTKANSLVEASYRLNISEQRVMALLVAQIHPDDDDFKPYRFKASDLQEMIESANKDEHNRLKELARGLLRKTLQIRRPNGGWLMTNWLSSAEYFSGKGEVELCFDPKLKPYLLQLQERFTSYKLLSIVRLRRRHSVRLYELLKQYASLGERGFELGDLRDILGLVEGEYSTWFEFKRNVLEPAKRELPKKTDIGFSYTVRKRVRAVAFVDFKIWYVDQEEPGTKKKAALKSGSTAKADELRAKAHQCWNRTNGSCAAKWADHENPDDACHWCRRFDKQRAEAANA